MILTLITVTELLVDRGAYGNEFSDKFVNPLKAGKFEAGLSTNMWIMDSRIYSLFISRDRFVGYLSYYDLGNFVYRNEYPDDSAWVEFSPYSIYAGLAYRFHPERNMHMSIRAGYYENRIMDEVASSFLMDADVMIRTRYLNVMGYLHNFNPMTFFRGGLLKLPYSLGIGISGKWNRLSMNAGIRRIRGRDVEKFLSISYQLNPLFHAGISLTPDLDYSRFSFLLGLRKGHLGLSYRGYFPAQQLDFSSIITLEYNYASSGF